MQLMLLGAPASGKGTQATRLAQRFGLVHISTGEMLRQACAEGSDLGILAAEYLSDGQLVPDYLVVELVLDALDRAPGGFVMDGFPRTLRQAKAFDTMLQQRDLPLDAVILIEVADCTLIERGTGRRVDPVTGQIYHLLFAPPPAEIAERLEQRDDDSEQIVKERLGIYQRTTYEVVIHYQQQNLLTRVDGSGPPDEIFDHIFGRLSRNPRQTEQ